MTIVRDADSVVAYVNPAFEAMFGWASAEIVGKTTLELNLWGDLAQREQTLALFRREHRLDSHRVHVRRRDGTHFEGLLSLRPIEVGGSPGILTSFRDVSELSRTRADLEASEKRQRAIADATFEGIAIVHEGRILDAKQVGRELGVRYLLEGSVRRSRNRVRVTAQLIDALLGAPVGRQFRWRAR